MASVGAEQREYRGMCNICGTVGTFRGSLRFGREQFPCSHCRFSLRYRDQAAAILQQFACGLALCLDEFVKLDVCKNLSILEAALGGPFIRRFAGSANYVRSYLFDDVPVGECKNGVVCQDLQSTSFPDEKFDLVVTSDVMEHVADWRSVVRETARILRPGGAHVFSIPLRWPLLSASFARARVVNGTVEHIVEPRYHRAGDGEPALVFTDFGIDLLAYHGEVGMRARLFNSHEMLDGIHRFPSVIAVKPGGKPT